MSNEPAITWYPQDLPDSEMDALNQLSAIAAERAAWTDAWLTADDVRTTRHER